MMRTTTLITATILLLALSACADRTLHADEVASADASTPPDASTPESLPSIAAHETTATPGNLPAGHPPLGGDLSTGLEHATVIEAIDAGSYTYAHLEAPDGSRKWVAGSRIALTAGDAVLHDAGSEMRGWHSDTLDRTWDVVYFVSKLVPATEATAPHGGAAGLPDGHPPIPASARTPAPSPSDLQVAPLDGGLTISEIYARAAELAGNEVAFRGRVVKANLNILGRNWFHLQDGTGDPTSATHDLTVTSSDSAAVGDVIVARGQLATEQDFGGGYRYEVLVEDAALESR